MTNRTGYSTIGETALDGVMAQALGRDWKSVAAAVRRGVEIHYDWHEGIVYDWRLRRFRRVKLADAAGRLHNERVPARIMAFGVVEEPLPPGELVAKRGKRRNLKDAAANYLRQHGSATAQEIAAHIGTKPEAVTTAMKRDGRFKRCGSIKSSTGTKKIFVWTLAKGTEQ